MKGMIGKKHSEETKLKIRKSLMGHTVSNSAREKMRKGHLGKTLSESARRKLSILNSGSNTHLWKGGVTEDNQRVRSTLGIRLWRESVFSRDNYTCQKCKLSGGYLNAHHIKNFSKFPELRTAIDNGITLCKICHTRFHSIYGKFINTLEQLLEFINNK
jgi:predicted restriction endonuclease